ncbi:MAG: hypothetical protein JWM51_319 [Microbacteriaceae bacterium]|nr:hypothetical protein [Microbacteriaceae bacterium]
MNPATRGDTGEVRDTLELPGLPAATPKKRRRRRLGWVVALVVIVVLIVVAYFVAERIARDRVGETLRDELRSALGLPASHPVVVDLGGGSMLAQLAGKSIDTAEADIAGVPLGDITGDVHLAATGVPLDENQPVTTLRARVSVDEENVQKLRGYIADVDLDSISLGDGVVDVTTDFAFFGLSVPVKASVAPSVDDGSVLFDPKSVEINGAALPIESVLESRFGAIAESLLPTRSFCVAELLPEAMVLTAVDVTPRAFTLDLTADGAGLGPQLEQLGSCD